MIALEHVFCLRQHFFVTGVCASETASCVSDCARCLLCVYKTELCVVARDGYDVSISPSSV